MEKTPFDPPETVPQINANFPPSRPQQRPKRWLLLIPLAVILLGGGVFGANYIQKQNEIRAREEKLAALRQDIKKVILEDNALVLEMLDDGALEHITYAEFFKRAEKNKEERDVLVRKLRATEAGPYGEQVGNFVKLMETENEWVRAEESVSRASLEVSGKWDTYKTAIEQAEEATGAVTQARRDYMAAPYGEDYDEAASLNYAKSQLTSVNERFKDAFDEWKEANTEYKQRKNSAIVLISDWMRREPLYYPNFAPKRPVLELLVKKKNEHSDEGTSDDENTPKSGKAKVVETSTGDTTEAAVGPKATPTPSAPTRVRSTKPLDGERFPETRTDEITVDYTYNLDDDDLRYAINEMFARFGMTFKDKSYQANFEGKSWYQPDDRWTPTQIKRAMTARERANLDVLTMERNNRKSNVGDG